MGDNLMTDKQYATILIDEIAELDRQIETAEKENAVETAKLLKATRTRKQEKLSIVSGKR